MHLLAALLLTFSMYLAASASSQGGCSRETSGLAVAKAEPYHSFLSKSSQRCFARCSGRHQGRCRAAEFQLSPLDDTGLCLLFAENTLTGPLELAFPSDPHLLHSVLELDAFCRFAANATGHGALAHDDARSAGLRLQAAPSGASTVLSGWSAWGPCSAQPCERGVKRRTRACLSCASDAEEVHQQSMACTGRCPESRTSPALLERLRLRESVRGWTEWGGWSVCSESCGVGKRLRTRQCPSTSTLDGGMASCPVGREEVDSETCEERPCAFWTAWSACSATCGVGQRQRSLFTEIRTEDCFGPPCPVPRWSSWSPWAACSVSCGVAGRQSRSRTCGGASALFCGGASRETRRCGLPCALWSAWSAWSQCTATCGELVFRSRRRSCDEGDRCQGRSLDVERCDAPACPLLGGWSSWSICSVSCGTGLKRRQRPCVSANGRPCASLPQGEMLEMSMPCFAGSCRPAAVWGGWGEWDACSASCGGGLKSRSRECLSGDCEPGDGVSTVLCGQGPCPSWEPWSAWSPCDRTCGEGTEVRRRLCGGGDCAGDAAQLRVCNMPSCPSMVAWGPWSSWSECSATCGEGVRGRLRPCRRTSEALVERLCLGGRFQRHTQPCRLSLPCPR